MSGMADVRLSLNNYCTAVKFVACNCLKHGGCYHTSGKAGNVTETQVACDPQALSGLGARGEEIRRR